MDLKYLLYFQDNIYVLNILLYRETKKNFTLITKTARNLIKIICTLSEKDCYYCTE